MNNIESKKLHDYMQGAYDRSLIALSPKNYMPAASEFAKELATSPILENDRHVVANMGREALIPLVEIKVKVLSEIEIAIALIEGYQAVIPILFIGIEEIHKIKNRCPANSLELICDMYEIIRQMCNLIKHDHPTKHAQILKKLIRLTKGNNIIEYIFSPSFSIMHQEIKNFDRDRKSSLYNSFAYLIRFYLFYDLKSRSNKIQGFLQSNHHSAAYYLSLDAEGFDKVMEESQSDEKSFDIEECRIHMHRVWEFIRSQLLTQKIVVLEKQKDSYDGAIGLLKIGNLPITFERQGLRSKILEVLFPNGTPIQEPIPFDVVYDAIVIDENSAIWSKFDNKPWDSLDSEDRKKINKNIYDTCTGINTRIEQETESKIKDYIKVENVTLSINDK